MSAFNFNDFQGIIFDSSLTPSKEFEFDGLDSLCSGQNVQEGGKVMVNVVKINEKNKEALEKYNNKVIFELFPKIIIFFSVKAMIHPLKYGVTRIR